MEEISKTRELLLERYASLATKSDILKAPELKSLLANIKNVDASERAAYGQAVNAISQELKALVAAENDKLVELPAVDVTAPMDVNAQIPEPLPSTNGSQHPITKEIERISDIFYRMGYAVEESREIDDQYHMFETLNFPKGHPARDDYDTFMTEEKDADGHQLIAPAHTSTMQNRILKKYRANLEKGDAIAAIVPDRVFRNEDLDARHEHTFYQVEGVYVAKGVDAGMLIATLKTFLEEY